ncbi:hypothetical protein ZWY2020_048882 [Hordeum vulgare]|nr:hypothetical protein ZWY2020_048882 [Hordeum vulgare]
MKNLKDPKTKVLPSTTRGGKELPSSSALDSPSVMSKFATSPPDRNLDMSRVLYDACDTTARDAMLDTARDAMLDTAFPGDARDAILPDDAMLDTARDTPLPNVPLGVFPDAHIARVTANARDASETTDTIEVEPACAPARSSSPRYELPDIPEGYVTEGEIAEDFLACTDAYDTEKLLLKWKEKSREARMKNDPKFATSPIFVTDKDYEFSVDPEIISLVESDPFHGYESETVIAHLAKLSEIANLFTNEEKIRHYYILKLFPFSLKDDAKVWFTSLPPGCVRIPQEMVYYFCEKYFPAHKKQAALQEIYNFAQLQEESLPQAWGRLVQLQNALPDHPLKKNEILDILYNGLTDASRDHLDSCVDCVFREQTIEQGHPKRIDQDYQGINANTPSHPKEKKKDGRIMHASSPNTVTPEEPNDISASDAQTQSGDEHEPGDNMDSDVHINAQPSHDEDVEIEPTVNPDNPQPKKYDKNDFTARKHGKEREAWVQRPMPFPPKPSKKKDNEDFERFVEMIRPVFLQRLTDMLKMSLYAKYMKDIVTNKRKIPDLEISTMLANYTFKGGTPKKLGDPGVPTIPCSIKGNYVRTALCDLGAGVSVMPLSLYRRLELDKLTPTEISLQMADKSTAFPIGICEDVPVVVANTTILTDFVILDIPEDDAMAIILGRPFLNTAGAVIDCNKGNVTFHVNGNEYTVHFPKKRYPVHCINAIEKTSSILIESFECPIPRVKMKYDLFVGEIHIPIEVT